jgi:hypothetical protein
MKNKHAAALGKKGGKAGTGAAKARTAEQARSAAQARWATAAENKALKDQVAALIRAGSNINAEFCSWAPREVRAQLFEAWDAAVSSVPNDKFRNAGGQARQPERLTTAFSATLC